MYIWIRFCISKTAKIIIFYIKSLKLSFFDIKILKIPFYIDTRLLWGNSCEEMFGSVSRLMRFDVYFEITLNR